MPQYLLTSYNISASDRNYVNIELSLVCTDHPTSDFMDRLRAFLEEFDRESEGTRTPYQREIDRLSAPYFPEPKKETPLAQEKTPPKESITNALDRLEV